MTHRTLPSPTILLVALIAAAAAFGCSDVELLGSSSTVKTADGAAAVVAEGAPPEATAEPARPEAILSDRPQEVSGSFLTFLTCNLTDDGPEGFAEAGESVVGCVVRDADTGARTTLALQNIVVSIKLADTSWQVPAQVVSTTLPWHVFFKGADELIADIISVRLNADAGPIPLVLTIDGVPLFTPKGTSGFATPPPPPPRVLFLTDTIHRGVDVSSPSGADARCASAVANVLPAAPPTSPLIGKQWVALISDHTVAPAKAARDLVRGSAPIVNVAGNLIAGESEAIWTGGLVPAEVLTVTGQVPLGFAVAWTFSLASGLPGSGCLAGGAGSAGDPTSPSLWMNDGRTHDCQSTSNAARLYCISVPTTTSL